ncbi:putative endonuclease [encoded in trnfM-intron: - 2791708] [Leptolyngbya sp. NIES-3755]|nr:putative endonuclease [encoded in trnfM-intron: - 2791708] [Leptolyngbya sp. NIES-3755]
MPRHQMKSPSVKAGAFCIREIKEWTPNSEATLQSKQRFFMRSNEVFIHYGSEIHLVETEKRQRKPRSAKYRDAWMLMTKNPEIQIEDQGLADF